jgi:hypothetical protein
MHATRANQNDLGVFALIATALAIKPMSLDPVERRHRAPDTRTSESPSTRRSLFERLDHWFWAHEQRQVEAYLAESTDVHDLEARIRDLERGVMHRWS